MHTYGAVLYLCSYFLSRSQRIQPETATISEAHLDEFNNVIVSCHAVRLTQTHADRKPRMREAKKGRAAVAHAWFDNIEQRDLNRRNAMAPPEPNHFREISCRRKATTGMMPVMTLQLDITDL